MATADPLVSLARVLRLLADRFRPTDGHLEGTATRYYAVLSEEEYRTLRRLVDGEPRS